MKHTVIIDRPPSCTPSRQMPDGAVTGNGDTGLVWGGTSSRQRIYISKNNFRKAEKGGSENGAVKVIGGFDLVMPCFKFKPYHVEQRMDEAELLGRFSNGETSAEIKIVVCATQNIVLVELRMKGEPAEFTLTPWVKEGSGGRIGLGTQNQVNWVQRRFDSEGGKPPAGAVIALKTLEPFNDGDAAVYRYALSVVSDRDHRAYKAAAIESALAVDRALFEQLYAAHRQKWQDFWSRSSVELYDRELELNWYAGQYFPACCSGGAAPDTWGNFVTGDETVGSFCQGAFYGAVSSNHWELTDSLNGLPVDISAAEIIIMRWYGTYDKDYALNYAYPYLKKLGGLVSSRLMYENGRYVIRQGEYVNCVKSLGFVRLLFGCLSDMARELGVDGDEQEKCRQILDALSDFPVFENKGQKIYRFTEHGPEGSGKSSDLIWHVFPGGQVGLDSDNETLTVARNTLCTVDTTADDSGVCRIFPGAARLGVEPDEIIAVLKNYYRKFQLPNLLFNRAGSGLENVGITAATVNEMLLQSRAGRITLFPVWNMSRRADFTDLRAEGAFLVSACLEDGKLRHCRVISEKGKTLRLVLPQNIGQLKISLNGREIKSENSEIITPTQPGDTLYIVGK